MNFSRIFILRPIATTLVMVALFLVGMLAYKQLPVSSLPEVDYPTIQVITLYPGASPEVMNASVTAPLERQFGQMPGLSELNSASSGGASVVTMRFSLETPLDVAEQQVQAAINAANSYLPKDLPAPPIYNKVNPADTPILTLAITSESMPLPQMQDFIDTRLAQKLSQISGVGLVTLSGGQRPAVRVKVNPTSLAAKGLTLTDIRSAINNNNINQAKGSFDGPTMAATIDANDQLRSPEEYGNLVIAYKNGAPIRIRDVAEVSDDTENRFLAGWVNEKPAIILNVQRQPGANVIDVVDRIHHLLPQLKETLPGDIEISELSDRTVTIRASVHDVQKELISAIVLVVLVVFVFLRNIPATIIPGFAVPLSLVGTFALMYVIGYSLNNLTLMALTIATGFVVDDAIVVVENIARYLEKGDSPLQAALKGSKQICFTIISLTFSLIAVLIPLLFMQDLVGRLFREFSVTLAISILLSGFISLTLTPMMSAKLLKQTDEKKAGRLYKITGAAFDGLIHFYDYCLKWVLRHRRLTLLVAASTLGLTVWLYVIIPKGFFPLQDTGIIQGISEAPQNISFQAMAKRQQELAKVILEDHDVASLSSFIGIDGDNSTISSGRMQINLKPLSQRSERAPEIIRRLQKKLASIPDITLHMQPVQDLSVEDRVSSTQFQFTLDCPDTAQLSHWVPLLVEKLKTVPAITDVADDFRDKGNQIMVTIDRDQASRLGISVSDIDEALYDAFGQRQVSTIFTQSNQYRVVLEVNDHYRQSPQSLNNVYVASSRGVPVPLTSVASIREENAALVINRRSQFPCATISFNLSPGYALGEAVEAIRLAEQEIKLPPSVTSEFQGAARAFQASLSNTMWLIIAATVTMYIVLGVLYESYIHPITILSTLPSAGVGALLALWITGSGLDIIGIIGIILLIGIVKKNAIMMIDFALEAERHQGQSPQEAIHQACLLRFRPILMTTCAALFAALPLMLSTGVGAELRRPLGIAMVGGLLLSQALTLFTTPVIYLFFSRFTRSRNQRAEEEEEADESSEEKEQSLAPIPEPHA